MSASHINLGKRRIHPVVHTNFNYHNNYHNKNFKAGLYLIQDFEGELNVTLTYRYKLFLN